MQDTIKIKEEDKLRKIGKEETMNLTEEQKKSKPGSVQETGESLSKQQVVSEDRNIGLHIDLEKPNKDSTNVVSGSSNRSLHQALKHQQLSVKSETHTEKTGNLTLRNMFYLFYSKFQVIWIFECIILHFQHNRLLYKCQCRWLTGLQWGKQA